MYSQPAHGHTSCWFFPPCSPFQYFVTQTQQTTYFAKSRAHNQSKLDAHMCVWRIVKNLKVIHINTVVNLCYSNSTQRNQSLITHPHWQEAEAQRWLFTYMDRLYKGLSTDYLHTWISGINGLTLPREHVNGSSVCSVCCQENMPLDHQFAQFVAKRTCHWIISLLSLLPREHVTGSSVCSVCCQENMSLDHQFVQFVAKRTCHWIISLFNASFMLLHSVSVSVSVNISHVHLNRIGSCMRAKNSNTQVRDIHVYLQDVRICVDTQDWVNNPFVLSKHVYLHTCWTLDQVLHCWQARWS
jgi:hypothetical protein